MKSNLRIAVLLLAAFMSGTQALSANPTATPSNRQFNVGSLEVEQIGERGPAIILIPGLASGAWVWVDTIKKLSPTHRLYVVTLPGFDGRKAQAGVTLDAIQNSINEIIRTRDIKRPILIGHSLGGAISLGYAIKYSNTISGVIAIDGMPVFPGTEAMTGDRSVLAQRIRDQFKGQTAEQFAAGQVAYMKRIGVIDAAKAAELAAYSGRSDAAASGEFAAQLMNLDLRSQLGNISVPVVEISPYYEPDYQTMHISEAEKTAYYKSLLTGVKQLEVLAISPARHFAMFDQPEAFAALLDTCIASIPWLDTRISSRQRPRFSKR
jgi:pimeloyl-ACP methyl ester carboxylesterase